MKLRRVITIALVWLYAIVIFAFFAYLIAQNAHPVTLPIRIR